MEIYYNNKIALKFLTVGSTFLYENKLYMNTSAYRDDEKEILINAVNLETGELCSIDFDTEIFKVTAKVEVTIGNC